MPNSSFQFWEHKERVRQIAGIDNGEMTDVLLTGDFFVSLPVNPLVLFTFKVPNNQALVITRFEGFMYETTAFNPVIGAFDAFMTFFFKTSPAGLNPNQFRLSGAANAIANTCPIFFYNSGEVLEFSVIDPIGPHDVNLVLTTYAWLIPGGKVGNFENYKTLGAG